MTDPPCNFFDWYLKYAPLQFYKTLRILPAIRIARPRYTR